MTKNLNSLILGLGREGLSTYQFLRSKFPDKKLFLADEKSQQELDSNWQKIFQQDKHVDFFKLEKNSQPKEFEIIYLTPGFAPSKLAGFNLKTQNLSSNLELFFNETKKNQNIITIGVTGSKGKSTTAALIHEVLKAGNLKSYLGGNIGTPALDVLPDLIRDPSQNKKTYLVLELSSHQLQLATHSPQIAVLQNIFSEHADYYQNFAAYKNAKARITKFQTHADLLIYNASDKEASEIATSSRAKKLPFSAQDQLPIKLSATNLLGEHNKLNIWPSILIGRELNIPEDKILTAIKNFKGLPHRLEFVAEVEGVKYYNDSLSTNPQASIAALKAFKPQQVILIAGGFDRDADYQPLAQEIIRQQATVILLPDTGNRIFNNLKKLNYNSQKFSLVENLAAAVKKAKKIAKPGQVVLLSPASASFNQFKDYKQRGEVFRRLV